MPVDGMERLLTSGERDVANDREHENAKHHHQRLQPEQLCSSNHAKVQAACQRAATQSDGALQPAGAGELGVGLEFFGGRCVLDAFE